MPNSTKPPIIDDFAIIGIDDIPGLVAAKYNLDDPDKNGESLVVEAAKRNNIDFLKALVDAGADVAATNERGIDALQWAETWTKTMRDDEMEKYIKATLAQQSRERFKPR